MRSVKLQKPETDSVWMDAVMSVPWTFCTLAFLYPCTTVVCLLHALCSSLNIVLLTDLSHCMLQNTRGSSS